MTTALTGLEPPPLSLADRAYLALRDRLITLQIRPGEPIDDGQIARELEVGRTPVREALKRLENDRVRQPRIFPLWVNEGDTPADIEAKRDRLIVAGVAKPGDTFVQVRWKRRGED